MSNRPRELEEFIKAVEDLLQRRRKELREQSPQRRYREESRRSDAPTRFTLEELYHYFGWFREMRKKREKGGYTRPPRREDIAALALKYQCELAELNVLLTSAGYAPIAPDVVNKGVLQAIESIEQVIDYLPIPAVVVIHNQTVVSWNEWFVKLFGINSDVKRSLFTTEWNLLRLIFNPDSPMHQALRVDIENWEYIAWLSIYRFKEENLLHKDEEWYMDIYQSLGWLPRFEEFWDATQPGVGFRDYPPPGHYDTYQAVISLAGQIIRLKVVNASERTADNYPRAILYIPADEHSAQVLTKHGFPTPGNWWGFRPEKDEDA